MRPWVREDILAKGMATRSSILPWRIPWSLEGCYPWGCEESYPRRYNKVISCFYLSLKPVRKKQLHLSFDTRVSWILRTLYDMIFPNIVKLLVKFQTIAQYSFDLHGSVFLKQFKVYFKACTKAFVYLK